MWESNPLSHKSITSPSQVFYLQSKSQARLSVSTVTTTYPSKFVSLVLMTGLVKVHWKGLVMDLTAIPMTGGSGQHNWQS